jgi:hypothetical protein
MLLELVIQLKFDFIIEIRLIISPEAHCSINIQIWINKIVCMTMNIRLFLVSF